MERDIMLYGRPQGEPEAGGAPGEENLGTQKIITQESVLKARATLELYRQGKKALENRVIEDEQWYKLRHWEYLRRHNVKKDEDGNVIPSVDPEPTSAWLFDALAQKHADAMDSYPVPAVLPRELSDEKSADTLSEVLPVVLERNDFEQVYSDNWWEKLKNGTAVYGVFWDSDLENGLGDVSIKAVDILNIFWEPGKEDIQDSRNVFVLSLQDNDLLEDQYPQLKGKLGSSAVDMPEYIHDETIDTTNKSVVVDWYYKIKNGSKTVLHYVKFVSDTVLMATENDPRYSDGLYNHGKYPFVFDTLFPEKDTPVGFGYIAIAKDPQMYIDRLSGNILKNSMMVSRPRFFVAANTGVNKKQFADWNQDIVDVEGTGLDETRIRQIEVSPVPGNVHDVLQMKINELKETSSNRDFSAGGTSGGVTAASAISALQESGNKTSRDMISASYRAYVKIDNMVLELMRQFYDQERSFRVVKSNKPEYVTFSNSDIKQQALDTIAEGMDPLYREPIFDIIIKAQRKNPFSQAAQNEMVKEFYSMGFFDPANAQASLTAIKMMEFDGKDEIMAAIQEGQTLMNMLIQVTAERDQLAAALIGTRAAAGAPQEQGAAKQSTGGRTPVMDAQMAGQAQPRGVSVNQPDMSSLAQMGRGGFGG